MTISRFDACKAAFVNVPADELADMAQDQINGVCATESDATTALLLIHALATRVAYLEAQPEREAEAYWRGICEKVQRGADNCTHVSLLNHEAAHLLMWAKRGKAAEAE